MSVEQENLETFKRLEASFPHPGWEDEFRRTHAPDVTVNQPGRAEPITNVEDHIADVTGFGSVFPDLVIDLPHRVLFASGDSTCSITRFHGTMTNAMPLPEEGEAPATGKRFEADLCTVAIWRDGVIVEENLFYDLAGMMQQVGLA
jgi:hypothetical protein